MIPPLKAVILGAGGHAAMVVTTLTARSIEVVGLVDVDRDKIGKDVEGARILGTDDDLDALRRNGASHFIVGVGGVRDNQLRKSVFGRGVGSGLEPLSVVHPAAVVAESATLGDGCFVGPLAAINPRAALGMNCLVNTSAVVEHDCRIGDHVHIAPRAAIAGGALLEAGAHIGMGAVVIEGRTVGVDAVVGAGAVVIDDVPPGIVVAGVPARPLSG